MRLRGLPLKLVLWLGPLVYLIYIKLVFLTSRKSFHGFEGVSARIEDGDTVLAAGWHQDAMIGPYAFRDRNIVTMASLSRDGELLARVMKRCGYKVVRGSSSRRGMAATKEIAQYLKPRKGSLCMLAADGPRGPARKAKKGIVFLAKHVDAPIYPIRCGARRRILNKSWDETTIPLPFNELIWICGEPVTVAGTGNKEDIETARIEIEKRLNELTETVERRFNRKQGPDENGRR